MSTQKFERLYEEHAQGLFGFLAYRTGDTALAEELVADVFQSVVAARRPLGRRKASERTWIYSVALHRLRDAAVHAARETVMPALATLDDEEREALSLRYGGGLSLRDIAEVVGASRSTVEGRIHRGLKHLRAELLGEGEQVADARAAFG